MSKYAIALILAAGLAVSACDTQALQNAANTLGDAAPATAGKAKVNGKVFASADQVAVISTGGLKPAEEGKRLNGATGKVATTDGPFTEAKEVVGGYAVFEAPDLRAATKLAAEFLQMHIDNGLPNITLELREIAGGANY